MVIFRNFLLISIITLSTIALSPVITKISLGYIEQYGIWMFISQIAISGLGVPAMYIAQSLSHDKRRWASVLGLVGQPFWFLMAYLTGAWGVLAMSFFYTHAWGVGFYNHWFKAKEGFHGEVDRIKAFLSTLKGRKLDVAHYEIKTHIRELSNDMTEREMWLCNIMPLCNRLDDILRERGDKLGLPTKIRLCKMLGVIMKYKEDFPLIKTFKWLGFIEGVLWANNLINVEVERNFAKPYTHAIYRYEGAPIPESFDISEERMY